MIKSITLILCITILIFPKTKPNKNIILFLKDVAMLNENIKIKISNCDDITVQCNDNDEIDYKIDLKLKNKIETKIYNNVLSEKYEKIISGYNYSFGFGNYSNYKKNLMHFLKRKSKTIKKSIFLFSLYIVEINGELNTKTNDLALETEAILSVYHFDEILKKFIEYDEIDINNEIILNEDYITSSNMEQMKKLLRKSVIKAYIKLSKDLSSKLSLDDNFGDFIVINNVYNGKVSLNLDLKSKIDSPYIALSILNSKIHNTGFIKAGKTKESIKSNFYIIQGNVSSQSYIKKYPWSGVLGGISVGIDSLSINSKIGGIFPSFQIDTIMDLGYLTNVSLLSEVWINLAISSGSGKKYNITPSTLSSFNVDISKRMYISKSGWYISPKVGFKYSLFNMKNQSAILKVIEWSKVKISDISLKVGINTGYNMGVNKELFLDISYSQSMLGELSGIGKPTTKFKVNRGVSLYLGYRHHIKLF